MKLFLDKGWVEDLKSRGVLIFDVDDTLLARREGSTAKGEMFGDSRAAMTLPQLITSGIRIALVTGHGWEQLSERLIEPLSQEIGSNIGTVTDGLVVYANRGASKMVLEGSAWKADDIYSRNFVFHPSETETLLSIMNDLRETLGSRARGVGIELRENSILSLRVSPGAIPEWESVRRRLIALGQRRLSENKLDTVVQIGPAGKNSIEIASLSASKIFACKDIFAKISASTGETAARVRGSSLYFGDEFDEMGNDLEVAETYADLRCISVGGTGTGPNLNNLFMSRELIGSEGPLATYSLIVSILKVLD